MVELECTIKEGKTMAQSLFIGSLAWATRDESLKALFETVGTVVNARVVVDHDTNRSKGFGFIEFEEESNNQKAIDQLDGKVLDGRAITVTLAHSKPASQGKVLDDGATNDALPRSKRKPTVQ